MSDEIRNLQTMLRIAFRMVAELTRRLPPGDVKRDAMLSACSKLRDILSETLGPPPGEAEDPVTDDGQ